MKETKEIPSTIEVAGWMALPIGFMWSASFLCTMYGPDYPLLSMLSTALALISIYMLYKQLTNYRKLYPSTGWLHILRLALTTCLLAGLLTDAAQYAYFLWLDNGGLLSQLGNAMNTKEYQEIWQQIMPEADMKEVQKLIESMTVRDIMMQLILYNVFLALPVSLLAALPVKRGVENKD